MMRNVYELERIFALEQQEREARMRHEGQALVARGGAARRFARLAFVAYVLTLFRPA